MTEESFLITIEGCWRDSNDYSRLPEYPGMFFLFEAKKGERCTIKLRLIYIGAAENVRNGILDFKKKFNQLHYLRYGNILCYQFAPVEASVCERIQAAFIYAHKPPANNKYKYTFPFASTRVISEGKIGFLKEDFRV